MRTASTGWPCSRQGDLSRSAPGQTRTSCDVRFRAAAKGIADMHHALIRSVSTYEVNPRPRQRDIGPCRPHSLAQCPAAGRRRQSRNPHSAALACFRSADLMRLKLTFSRNDEERKPKALRVTKKMPNIERLAEQNRRISGLSHHIC